MTAAPVPVPVRQRVRTSAWTSCTDGTEVVNYAIADGGHTWPGATVDSGPGVTTHAIDATRLITSFFAAHPLHDR
ncbi:poly(3-hydroxybutyrate) depolymerase [Catenulispora sp. MAP5-51]|uniref:hypothetical protein n=1 Tax=Catenulispora sp. MAP5-51 TaxID=3156298 RepID=UPI003511FDF8